MSPGNVWRDLRPEGPAEEFWRSYTLPRRGEYAGLCNNPLCPTTGADWLNRVNDRYYCDDCARWINEACLKQGIRKHCELHVEHHF
jgi:hypothetical protein